MEQIPSLSLLGALAAAWVLAVECTSLRWLVLDLTPLQYARIPWNALAFWVRRRFAWSRGEPVLGPEPLDALFAYLPGARRVVAEERARSLSERFGLEALRAACTRGRYRENLAVLDMLEGTLELMPEPSARTPFVVDVGARDWDYVFALGSFVRDWAKGRRPTLLGVELDGHGLHRDLRSRADHARAYARQASHVSAQYEVSDFLVCEARHADLVTMFYPFVLRFTIVAWGLPLGHFEPARHFEKAAEVLSDGGLLLVVNHTREEFQRTLALVDETGEFEALARGPVGTELIDYFDEVRDRHVSLFRRRGRAS